MKCSRGGKEVLGRRYGRSETMKSWVIKNFLKINRDTFVLYITNIDSAGTFS